MKYTIDWLDGNGPVQGEGTISFTYNEELFESEWYFRARGNSWSLSIEFNTISNPELEKFDFINKFEQIKIYDVYSDGIPRPTWVVYITELAICKIYSDEPYAAGWMKISEAEELIKQAFLDFEKIIYEL